MRVKIIKHLVIFKLCLTVVFASCSKKNDYCSSFNESLGEVKTVILLDTVKIEFVDYWGFFLDTNIIYTYFPEPYSSGYYIDSIGIGLILSFDQNYLLDESDSEVFFKHYKLALIAQANADSFSNVWKERINEKKHYFLKKYMKTDYKLDNTFISGFTSFTWLFDDNLFLVSINRNRKNNSIISDTEMELRTKCILQNLKITYLDRNSW